MTDRIRIIRHEVVPRLAAALRFIRGWQAVQVIPLRDSRELAGPIMEECNWWG
jgi:hypothetical protein